MICEHATSEMIGTVEAALIKWNRPLWNSLLAGFGNHDPGKGRYKQVKSDWDVIHPGRHFAEKCKGAMTPKSEIIAGIEMHLKFLGANVDSTLAARMPSD